MFEVLLILFCLSIILVVIGMIWPKYVFLWNGKRAKRRWKVFLFYSGMAYLLFALGLGSIASWLFTLDLVVLLTAIISIVLLIIGIIRPNIVLRMKKRITGTVLVIHLKIDFS
ncbi:hypothetical protein [Alkalihalobacillus sp. R86527]|uniref:hypothetical protein n=1 Tax=Alkalihalobacillus sp. R86527 TaxID=3093863 RepID=UPI0036722039